MSADNWAECPKCVRAAEAEKRDLARQVTDGYGVLPIEQWDELRARASAEIDHQALRTFREDYEIYGAEDGKVTVVYDGGCQNCGIGLKFEYKQAIPGIDDA